MRYSYTAYFLLALICKFLYYMHVCGINIIVGASFANSGSIDVRLIRDTWVASLKRKCTGTRILSFHDYETSCSSDSSPSLDTASFHFAPITSSRITRTRATRMRFNDPTWLTFKTSSVYRIAETFALTFFATYTSRFYKSS